MLWLLVVVFLVFVPPVSGAASASSCPSSRRRPISLHTDRPKKRSKAIKLKFPLLPVRLGASMRRFPRVF